MKRRTPDAPDVIVARQARIAAALANILSFAPVPPPREPVTDAERAALRARRDAALANIETFKPRDAA